MEVKANSDLALNKILGPTDWSTTYIKKFDAWNILKTGQMNTFIYLV